MEGQLRGPCRSWYSLDMRKFLELIPDEKCVLLAMTADASLETTDLLHLTDY